MDTTNSSATTNAPSLKRSLTKVKSALSSKFKSDPSDSLDDDNHILKAMKYEETDSSASTPVNTTRSNSNISTPYELESSTEQIRAQPVPSSVLYQNPNESDVQIRARSIIETGRNNTLEGNLLIEVPILQRNNSSDKNISNDLTFREEEKLLPAMPYPLTITAPTNALASSALASPLAAVHSQESTRSQQLDSSEGIFRPVFESRSELTTMLSPPISPSRQKSVLFDPLGQIKEETTEKNTVKSADDIVGVNDVADAMAFSILDKVDNVTDSTEWKI